MTRFASPYRAAAGAESDEQDEEHPGPGRPSEEPKEMGEVENEEDVPSAIFLDTNILVFAASLGAPLHQRASDEIRKRHAAGQVLWVSRQILREYLATLSRPQTFARPKPVRELVRDIRYFLDNFSIAEEGAPVTEKLLELVDGREIGGKRIHDANIVATMLANGIPTLLTHNADDFARFADVIKVIRLKEEDEG